MPTRSKQKRPGGVFWCSTWMGYRCGAWGVAPCVVASMQKLAGASSWSLPRPAKRSLFCGTARCVWRTAIGCPRLQWSLAREGSGDVHSWQCSLLATQIQIRVHVYSLDPSFKLCESADVSVGARWTVSRLQSTVFGLPEMDGLNAKNCLSDASLGSMEIAA